MKKRVKLTPFWDLYMIKRGVWEKSHSNTSTLEMLEAFGVYKGLGGKKDFNIDNVEFSTEKSKNNSKALYDQYIEMISDYIFFYNKIFWNEFDYRGLARELFGRKYKSLTMLRYSKDDILQIRDIITKYMAAKLSEKEEYIQNILVQSESIYKQIVSDFRVPKEL